MVFIGNIIYGIAIIASYVLKFYSFVVIASALISFVNPDPYNQIVRILREMTEPVFYQVRKYLPFVVMGMVDLSPIVVLFALQFLEYALVRNLLYMAHKLIGPSF